MDSVRAVPVKFSDCETVLEKEVSAERLKDELAEMERVSEKDTVRVGVNVPVVEPVLENEGESEKEIRGVGVGVSFREGDCVSIEVGLKLIDSEGDSVFDRMRVIEGDKDSVGDGEGVTLLVNRYDADKVFELLREARLMVEVTSRDNV